MDARLKAEVRQRAGARCEYCWFPEAFAELRFQVDHIIPRSHDGKDDIENLQALCYSCNAMKRDRDDADLRAVRESYTHRETGCLFCDLPKERVVLQNELAYSIYDGFPVTEHHTLVIPKRHLIDYFSLSRPELNACDDLLREMKEKISTMDDSVTAFNIGMNAGEDAGQTIFHCHIHLIPRRRGDVPNPKGGVRHVIAGKGIY